MSNKSGVAIFGPDAVFQGRISGAKTVEVAGYVEGEINSRHVSVAKGGRLYGRIMAGSAKIDGQIQGDVFVKTHIDIGATGAVNGRVQYGTIQMAAGGELSAELKNVPPSLAGDFETTVYRGRSVVITRADLQAIDPDDAPEDLLFTVTRADGGYVAMMSAPAEAITSFRQADLDAGHVLFQHDGTEGTEAAFAVSVRDDDGASSAIPATIKVSVAD